MKYAISVLALTMLSFVPRVPTATTNNFTASLDTAVKFGKLKIKKRKKNIFWHLDSICKLPEIDLDVNYVYLIGKNESGWRHKNNLAYIRECGIPKESSKGDLQVNPVYHPIKGMNRLELLYYACRLLRRIKESGDYTWEEVRYIYGRGKLKPPHTWTKLERKFMTPFRTKLFYSFYVPLKDGQN